MASLTCFAFLRGEVACKMTKCFISDRSLFFNQSKKFNKVSNLHRSKWTSLKKLNGWKHYEVVNIDKKNDFIELFAICDRSKKTIVNKKNLKNINLWKRGWK